MNASEKHGTPTSTTSTVPGTVPLGVQTVPYIAQTFEVSSLQLVVHVLY